MRKERALQVILWLVLTAVAAYTLFPLLFLLINAFKSQSEIIADPMKMPANWDFNYIFEAVKKLDFANAFATTFVITFCSVLLIVVLAALSAWMMVRSNTRLSRIQFLMFTAAMLVPFQAIMYPLMSEFEILGLRNVAGLILMYGGFGMPMSIFLYHGFIKTVPVSLEEAAVLDGANIFQVFFQVVLPLLKSTTATCVIINAMWIWNDYLLPFLVIGTTKNRTLTLALYAAKVQSGQYGNPWELIFPAVLVTILPVIILYVFLQKYFVKSVTSGAVKG